MCVLYEYVCGVCVYVCIVCVYVCVGGGTDSGLHAVCDITPKLVQAVPTMAASFPCFHLQQASQSSNLFTPFAPKPLVICPFDYHQCLVCDLASPRLRFLWIISKFRLCQNCVFWGCKAEKPPCSCVALGRNPTLQTSSEAGNDPDVFQERSGYRKCGKFTQWNTTRLL